jgi:Uma2 family endonuclease
VVVAAGIPARRYSRKEFRRAPLETPVKLFDFPPSSGILQLMATVALPRPAARKRLWTYDEMVAELPESNLPMELWDGEIVMSPTLPPKHQQILMNFAIPLGKWVTKRKLGEVFIGALDVILTPRRVVQPDVFFIAKARLNLVTDRVRCAPDLAVEVISAGSWKRDRVEKKGLYEQHGVREYWIIDPESQTIEVFALERGAFKLGSKADLGETAASKLLSGFQITWSQLLL